ncbi:MAG: GNAT family N-acetyltransferase [Bacteriovorax sp.]|nr:GNAT family N-acetyltransferase [Bacteriovorax sp.]
MNITIRKAKLEDAAEIANVHINSWREAYKDILDANYLDETPLNFKNRHSLWKKLISQNEIVYVAESDKYGIVGFANAGIARDKRFESFGEIYCIYLFKKAHKLGVGFQLLKSCFQDLKNKGHDKAYLWVLENNPTIHFYERSGAKKMDYILEDTIGSQSVREFCYAWDSLDFTLNQGR